jgi:L-fuconolactonase
MADGMDGLRRDFLIEDLHAVASEVGITGAILVECERTVDETVRLSGIANGSDLICGVVGWAPLTSSTIVSELERIACLPKMKAVRHPIHDEVDDQFVLRKDFNYGITALGQFDLRFDILIFERHLPQTIQFVDRHPNQVFVLDHIAKPRIRDRVLSPWKENLTELARRQNVYCKLSGLVTEANWHTWSGKDLHPYVEAVLDAFTPKRVMFGSDWPLVTLASSYGRWSDTVRAWIAQLSPTEQDWILSRTAQEAYGLAVSR